MINFMRTLAHKDPDSIVSYSNDWTDWLDGENLVTSVFSVASGTVTIQQQSNTTKIAKVVLVGGTAGETCIIHNRVTTASRTEDRSFRFTVKPK